MTVQSALSGVESILAIINKGSADPATKLKAITQLAEAVRSDIRDLADAEYATYIQAPSEPPFDMKDAVEKLAVPLRTQIYFNLFDFYNRETFMDEHDPFIRMALAKALLLVAAEKKEAPNPLWSAVVQCDGELEEVSE